MLLVAVETMHQQCYKKFSAEPREIIYENYTYPCQKLNLNNLPRRRLAGCYNEHPRVSTSFLFSYLDFYVSFSGTRNNNLWKIEFDYLRESFIIFSYRYNILMRKVLEILVSVYKVWRCQFVHFHTSRFDRICHRIRTATKYPDCGSLKIIRLSIICIFVFFLHTFE